MPHVVVKMLAGRPEAQKQALTAKLTEAVMSALGVEDASISIAIEDVTRADWTDNVYVPDIREKIDQLYKKPGYDPFA
ncbi:4-oxalocrotonate tautomerase [Agrobacterium rhizogenes]|uniref:Tautomerase family protein n=2 Tax=unclassified Rhizobium TaxID=2613769 RepID=A0AAU7SIH3_9HYPH|nr:4-oxalocrotonate tautomerase [Rhizobium rhizogenes]NTJ80955.1 4-oxalocrotonate tautomerase [Rhizobium rhizogenes]